MRIRTILILLILLNISMILFASYTLYFALECMFDAHLDIEYMQRQIDESRAFREQMQEFMNRLQIQEMTTTYYSPHDDKNGLNSWRPLSSRSYTVRTRLGTIPGPGTAAVDPDVIPLGTPIWIEGYGFGLAEDTGGRIKGKHIDLYVPTFDEAIQRGRGKAVVMWIKAGE